uniref:Uncharacterized protein n=1 Tax=Amphimedon queenslandica TaxID=400682 RepID=A0A1X7URZ3_AMPQE
MIIDHIEKVLTRLMFQGKIRAAMCLLTETSKGNVLNTKDSVKVSVNGTKESVPVIDTLRSKHPSSQSPHSSTFLQPNEQPSLSHVKVTGAHISLISQRIQDSTGPGWCDSSHWQDALLRFGTHSRRLCDSVAVLSRCLSNSIFHWDMTQALLVNRSIALDKCPGIQPIRVGETLLHIIGKAVCYVTREDAESICGVSKLCAGLKHGIKGAIHAMNDVFTDNDDHGALMVDARNAFSLILLIGPLCYGMFEFSGLERADLFLILTEDGLNW